MTFLDQTRDTNGQRLLGLLNTTGADGAKLFQPPDFVKAASQTDITGGDTAGAPGNYGNPRDRLFPCHTSPATWVSALFFHSQKAAMDRGLARVIEQRIDAAAKHHGIGSFVEQVKTAVARAVARTEAQLGDDDFALVIQYADAPKERHLPIRNAAEIKTACAYLRTYYDQFTFDDRAVIAEKILAKAAQHRVALGTEQEVLEKQAGHGSCSPETAAELLYSRAKAVRLLRRDLDMAGNLAKMAMQVLERPDYITLPSNLKKVAGFVDRVDREYGLAGLKDLARPEDVLFQVNVKVAKAVLDDHVSLTSGNIYSKQALAGVSLEDVRSVMGDGFVSAVSDDGLFFDTEKFAEVARTMPRDDAELFDSLMAQLHVRPVYKEAAHAASGPMASAESLLALAGMHPNG